MKVKIIEFYSATYKELLIDFHLVKSLDQSKSVLEG